MTLSGLEWDFQNTGGITQAARDRADEFKGTIDKFRRPGEDGEWASIRRGGTSVLVRTNDDALNTNVAGSVESLTTNIRHALSQGLPERAIYVLVRNEPNLNHQIVDPDHGLQIGQAVKSVHPGVRLVTTTFSQNFGLPFDRIQRELDSPLFEFVGTHCYWERAGYGDWSKVWMLYDQQARQRGKKFLVCEMNERSLDQGRAQRTRTVMQEMAATGRCEAIVIFVGEADAEFNIFKPDPEECKVLGFPLTFPVPTPDPDPGPEPGPVPMNPNPHNIQGIGPPFLQRATEVEAVIDSTEIDWIAEDRIGQRKVGQRVRTTKGYMYYSDATGVLGPFGPADQ